MTNSTAPAPTILDEIRSFMDRFVIFTDEDHRTVLALWVLHTHTFDAAYSTPYIYVNSAEKQSGKTRLMETIALLAKNPDMAANQSTSSMFRSIESTRPTLFMDEVDSLWSGAANEELRGMLNAGYRHNGKVKRVVPVAPDSDDDGVRYYSVFCPKFLAGIDNGHMPDTIADRCINIVLKRKKSDQGVERMRPRIVEPQAEELRERISQWAEQNMDKIIGTDVKPMETISDRAEEIAEPLVALAMQFRGETQAARKALTNLLSAKKAPLSIQAQVLLKAREIMDETGADKITSATLAEAMDTSAKRIGILLAPYGITPRSIRLGSNTIKGYHRRDFVDAWERYL